jgi:putative phage-type endonuclease
MEIVQGTPEWLAARCGLVTASRIADVVAKDRTGKGWGVSRANYAAQLICERLTGVVSESYTSPAMQWGTDHEPEARAAYQFEVNKRVELVGFVKHPTIGQAGASPDGLVGDDGLVQFKCPESKKHIETLMGAPIDGGYQKQMLWEMACTGRQWCDFVSFDPRLPESMKLCIRRFPRDAAAIAELEANVIDFLNELRLTVHRLRSKYEPEKIVPGELLTLAAM